MRLVLIAATVVAALHPLIASAHGGGLDALGCHNDRKRGGYHCHRGPLAGRSFSSKAEAMRALGIGVDRREPPPRSERSPSHSAVNECT